MTLEQESKILNLPKQTKKTIEDYLDDIEKLNEDKHHYKALFYVSLGLSELADKDDWHINILHEILQKNIDYEDYKLREFY